MRLFGVQREASREQAELARLRVAAMGNRSGWVPKVPAGAVSGAADGHVGERTATAWQAGPIGSLTPPDRSSGQTARGTAGRSGLGREGAGSGEAGRRGLGREGASSGEASGGGSSIRGAGSGEASGGGSSIRGASSGEAGHLGLGGGLISGGQGGGAEPGRNRSAASAAVADRLPLPLRAVMESLPSGVRRGEVGLERGHALVVVLVVLLGLAVAALLTGLGRPRVAPVDPTASSTIVATGTPAADAEAPSGHPDDPPAGSANSGADSANDGADPANDGAEPVDDGAELVVHVAGKVADPGVVELPPGSRVLDAIEAAGGADADVDLTPLNLARLLIDGEQVAVGIDPAPDAAPTHDPAAAAGGLINLNTATADQLETLPGIGPTLAGQILLWREQNGRFTAIEELQEVSGIGPKKFAAIADQVTV